MPSPPDGRVARRLKALREQQQLTQATLAERMGLPHRQTLTSIEAGERPISPEELAMAAAALGLEVNTFTDPYRLIGEGEFSFRADGVSPEVLNAFQERARRWVATYRALLDRAGVPRSHLGRKLELREDSSYEHAQAAAEELRREWNLGDVPAQVLAGAIEREAGARVLFVDAPRGISGAAIHLPGLNTILVNRHETLGRRHFDIAHELFHLLTWDAMAPNRVEPREVPRRKGNRVEKLADNFAGALLMPADVVGASWEARWQTELADWMNALAARLQVTAMALKWRLVVLGHLSKPQAEAIADVQLASGGVNGSASPPLPFDREFAERVHGAVETGLLSLRRALGILDLTAQEFADLCRAYGLTLSYEV